MINKKIRYGILYLALSLLTMNSASAEGQAPFMEGSLALLTTNVQPTTAGYSSSNVNTMAFIYRLGMPVLDYYAVEFMLGTGLSNGDSSIGEVGLNSLLGADFKATYPFGKGFEGFVRGGLARIAVDVTGMKNKTSNAITSVGVWNGFGITLGLGGVYDMGKYGKIFVEYQRLPNVDINIDTGTLNPTIVTGSVNASTSSAAFAIGYQFFLKK